MQACPLPSDFDEAGEDLQILAFAIKEVFAANASGAAPAIFKCMAQSRAYVPFLNAACTIFPRVLKALPRDQRFYVWDVFNSRSTQTSMLLVAAWNRLVVSWTDVAEQLMLHPTQYRCERAIGSPCGVCAGEGLPSYLEDKAFLLDTPNFNQFVVKMLEDPQRLKQYMTEKCVTETISGPRAFEYLYWIYADDKLDSDLTMTQCIDNFGAWERFER